MFSNISLTISFRNKVALVLSRLYFENSPPSTFDGSVFESFRTKDVGFPVLSDEHRMF